MPVTLVLCAAQDIPSKLEYGYYTINVCLWYNMWLGVESPDIFVSREFASVGMVLSRAAYCV